MGKEKTAAERRKELATLLFCQSYLYYHDMLSSAESERVCKRISAFQDKHRSLSRGSRSTVWKLNIMTSHDTKGAIRLGG